MIYDSSIYYVSTFHDMIHPWWIYKHSMVRITGFSCSRALQGSPRQVLRQRRFALRDHFDLTRAPDVSAPGSLGGLHAIEIQVGLEGLGEDRVDVWWTYGWWNYGLCHMAVMVDGGTIWFMEFMEFMEKICWIFMRLVRTFCEKCGKTQFVVAAVESLASRPSGHRNVNALNDTGTTT